MTTESAPSTIGLPVNQNMRQGTVSIVTPTFNCAPLLQRAIDSVLKQTHQDWELLVVDNHSTDGTEELVHSYRDTRIRYFKIQNNGVIAASRNLAILQARGAWLAFLDADDWWTPDKLEICIRSLRQGWDVVYHDLHAAGPGSKGRLRRRVPSRALRQPVLDDLLSQGNALPNSSVVVRRSLIDRVGRLSEEPALIAIEDFDCWLRVARVSDRFFRIEGAHGFYWMSNGNTTNPRRTISTLNELRTRLVNSSAIAETPPWMAFALAKAHLQLSEREAGYRELNTIQLSNAPLLFLFKKLALRALHILDRP
jgi:glycosyltransferase involved in cell wall biosynthesis